MRSLQEFGRHRDSPMVVVERVMNAAPFRAFRALSDPWLMPAWVVGATHIRDVDEEWPAEGARLHHKIGAWPLALSDTTSVVECEPPNRLVLQGRAYPFGQVRIELTVRSHDDGALVIMAEAPIQGLVLALDNPVQRRILKARNRESLDRLAAIAEHRWKRVHSESA